MAIASSGSLSLDNIQTEFGGSSPIDINEYYAGGSYVPAGCTGTNGAVPSSGTITISNFYGTSATLGYVEDLFSTYLYTGNGGTQTIANGINLSTYGGLVWRKQRTANVWTAWTHHSLSDTAQGVNAALSTSRTTGTSIGGDSFVTAFNSNGFSIGPDSSGYGTNKSSETYVSWTFRKATKFFDVVTYTGNGLNQTIAHSLGSVPGCIIVKQTSGTSDNWVVYHRELGYHYYLQLNLTDRAYYDGSYGSNGWIWYNPPTSSAFSVNSSGPNAYGQTYVAYIFAHNAGGYGATGADNIISCGSFTTNGSGNATVDLGYEPQWILVKTAFAGSGEDMNWQLFDSVRGMTVADQTDKFLYPNAADTEMTGGRIGVTSTGFSVALGNNSTQIYIAIRRGPMKTPTSGTSVFEPSVYTGDGTTSRAISTNFPVDLAFWTNRTGAGYSGTRVTDRLRGVQKVVLPYNANEESNFVYGYESLNSSNVVVNASGYNSPFIGTVVQWLFRRAPGFFDEVCYTGTGAARTLTHNLGVAPELMIVKSRSNAFGWFVYSTPTGAANYLMLQSTAASAAASTVWNDTAPTTSVFSIGNAGDVNNVSSTYVAYLFASCPGVSKVGTYTGTGATQTINCGFTAGARFVLIKRSDSTGDWYVWDTARGMVAGTDPSLLLNSTAAEVNANSIYTTTGGFQIVSTAAGINASGGSYIYLAIA